MIRYNQIFEAEIKIINYSEMPSKLIIAQALTNFHDAVIPIPNIESYDKEIDDLRYRLASKQHDKLQNIDSFKELEKCEIMMFRKE